MDKGSREKAAFITQSGVYEWKRNNAAWVTQFSNFSFSDINGKCSLSLFYSREDNSLPELLITEEEVDDQGVGIHSSKQPGPDGRSPMILK